MSLDPARFEPSLPPDHQQTSDELGEAGAFVQGYGRDHGGKDGEEVEACSKSSFVLHAKTFAACTSETCTKRHSSA